MANARIRGRIRARRAAMRAALALLACAAIASALGRTRGRVRDDRGARMGGDDHDARLNPIKNASVGARKMRRRSSYWAPGITTDDVKRNDIKSAAREAFAAYEAVAMGHDELAPVSNRGVDDFGGFGATLVDSLDTLYVMGLREEFTRALMYLKKRDSALSALARGEVNRDVSVFETNIRILGGLLSTYDLTGDADVLELSETLASRLSAAFQTPSGVPRSFVNVKTGHSFGLPWVGKASILADFGSMHLEWATLSARARNPIYEAHTSAVFDKIMATPVASSMPTGLFPVLFNPETGAWVGQKVSFGSLGDSFYEYLIKCWRSLDALHEADAWRREFDAAMAAMKTSLLHTWKTSENGERFAYVAPLGGDATSMEHLTCFMPGMLVLGGAEAPTQALADDYVQMAKDIARTCVAMYTSTPTGLSADTVQFVANATSPTFTVRKSIQRPETVESLFYLYRKTGDDAYRQQAWTIFQAMKRNYRTSNGGWQGIKDVSVEHAQGDDKQQSFFLAETLKYLYLTFSDGETMHLDEWVFNTEAHPFKITKNVTKVEAAVAM